MHRDQSDPRSLFYRDQRVLNPFVGNLDLGGWQRSVFSVAIGKGQLETSDFFGQAIITSMITGEVETVN